MKDIWPTAQEVEDVDRDRDHLGDVHRPTTPTSSPATSSGSRCRPPRARPSRGTPSRPTSASPRTSTACPTSRRRSRTSRAPGCCSSSATRSPPTTSRPAGAIKKDSPAGKYLAEHGVEQRDFNSYGSRRGNHEVMIRGTFANIRLRNQLAPGTEGGVHPRLHRRRRGDASSSRPPSSYLAAGTPLVVLSGKEYGSGSSRDWAAKGTALLGVKAVIAESYERIHRSNLIGMGVLRCSTPRARTPSRWASPARRRSRSPASPRSTTAPRRRPSRSRRRRRRRRVRRGRPHRHPRRGQLLPQRRDHAVRAAQPAQGLTERVVTGHGPVPLGGRRGRVPPAPRGDAALGPPWVGVPSGRRPDRRGRAGRGVRAGRRRPRPRPARGPADRAGGAALVPSPAAVARAADLRPPCWWASAATSTGGVVAWALPARVPGTLLGVWLVTAIAGRWLGCRGRGHGAGRGRPGAAHRRGAADAGDPGRRRVRGRHRGHRGGRRRAADGHRDGPPAAARGARHVVAVLRRRLLDERAVVRRVGELPRSSVALAVA